MGSEFNLSDTPASRYTDQGGKRPRCAAGNPAKGPAPVNALDVLRTFKPNLTLIGYAAFLAVNAAGAWGGVFPFLPMRMQTPTILFWFSLTQSLVFAACFFLSVLGVYHFPGPTRQFIVRLSALPYLLGWGCLIGAMYVDSLVLPLSIAGGALIGMGSAGFYMLWQRLFASLDSDTGNHNLILGTAWASVLYFGLHFVPRAVTVYLIPLVITPLFGLAISLKSRQIDLDQPMFEDVPKEHRTVYREAIRMLVRPALCVGSLGFCAGLIRALAIDDPSVGALVNTLSMGASLVTAAAFLMLWQFKSVRLNVETLYRVMFPVVTLGLVLLPLLGGNYAQWLAAALYAAYNVMIMLMMIQCAQTSRDQGTNPVFVYGFFGGIVYALHDAGFVGGSLAGQTSIPGVSTFAVAALGTMYILGFMYFYGQGGFEGAVRGSTQRIPGVELVSLKPEAPANAGGGSSSKGAGGRQGRKAPLASQAQAAAHGGSGTDATGGATNATSATSTTGGESFIQDRLSKQVALVRKRYRLSAREAEIAEHIVRGKTVVRIAEELVISENTVRMHSKRIYAKLDVHKKQDLIDLVEAARPHAGDA